MATATLNRPCCGKPKGQCDCYADAHPWYEEHADDPDTPVKNSLTLNQPDAIGPVDNVNFLPIPTTIETIVNNFGGKDRGPHSFDDYGGMPATPSTPSTEALYGSAPTAITPDEMLRRMREGEITDAERKAIAEEQARHLAVNSTDGGLPLPATIAQCVVANTRDRLTRTARRSTTNAKAPPAAASTDVSEGLPLPKTVEKIVNERRRS